MMPRSFFINRRWRAFSLYALVLGFALLAPAPPLRAQSGRAKQQQPTIPTSRPRRASTSDPVPEKSPAPTSSGQKSRTQPAPALPDDAPPWPPPPPRTIPADTNAKEVGEEVGAEDVVRINSNLVTVPASVVDASGKAITGLKIEDFELLVDGQTRTISDIGYSDSPVRLVLLFDNSSSLVAAREFEKQAAIRFFRNVMRPVDQAAIYSVSTFPILEQPFTNDVRRLVRTIENFGKPEGATALFDAVVQAANYLKPYQGRKVIVIVSDGADTISDIDFETTMQRLQSSDCQIYAVQTGHIENANLRDLAAERRLQEFAGQTGGAVYIPKGTGDLDAAFAQISEDLAQQYILSYYPTDDRRDGRFRVISLRVTTRQNVRIRARKGYYAPKG
jgi:Ca-activated chloride channel family protein